MDYVLLCWICLLSMWIQIGITSEALSGTDKRDLSKAKNKLDLMQRFSYLIPILGLIIVIIEELFTQFKKFVNYWNNLPDQ